MHILTLMGSPRKSGNTAAVLRLFEGLAASLHQVERINLVDSSLRGCLGCDACYKTLDGPGCIRRDDAPRILERIMGADLIVYASPVYVWSFTAQIKTLIDRHYCLVKWQEGRVVRALLEGKRAALLVTCGGTGEDNADLVQQIFWRQMDYLRCRVAGMYVVDRCTTPDRLGERAERAAHEMARELLGPVSRSI